MKIGKQFNHYPTGQIGFVKSRLYATGQFRAMMADGTIRRVNVDETSLRESRNAQKKREYFQANPPRKAVIEVDDEEEIQLRIAAMQAQKYPASFSQPKEPTHV